MTTINVDHQLATGRLGGDLWNNTTVARRAQRMGAIAVTFDYRGTGLWLDCELTMPNGGRKAARLFA